MNTFTQILFTGGTGAALGATAPQWIDQRKLVDRDDDRGRLRLPGVRYLGLLGSSWGRWCLA